MEFSKKIEGKIEKIRKKSIKKLTNFYKSSEKIEKVLRVSENQANFQIK